MNSLLFDRYWLFNNLFDVFDCVLALLFRKVRSSTLAESKEHHLRHHFDLFLSQPIYLFCVSLFPLQLDQSLSHNHLVLLCHGGHNNLLHAVHCRRADVCLLVLLKLANQVTKYALSLQCKLLSLNPHTENDLFLLDLVL